MIRPATADDVDAVARLERENLGDDAWSAALVEEGVSGRLPTVRYVVAQVGDDVVGHAVVSVVADLSELQRIAVAIAHRRTGVATSLLEEAADLARAEGADRLLLEVREDNAGAIAFYRARGFVEIDRRPRYYRDGGTAVVMQRPLR
ncbi:ribosomal protein S18-alanine N-acetyltransferase [Nocardioides sp.]|uniref:ribosomal protein S18-alanine N-acetyltransferase n=1 Tax=Nocardioides sp. TaxID=35761 RepID=UPI002D7FA75F|nr:ribosomal protein S18-alanine N-acetyltransferase [Nocardioides sp.]HET8959951.1 ribosomal protein S18-alanine N-acetyltransferase [Nocardioides sp.]